MNKGFGLSRKAKTSFTARAAAASELGNQEQAEKLCRIAIANNPSDLEAHQLLASLLFRQSRNTEFIDTCKSITRLDPNNQASHNNLGNALQSIGHFDEAKASYIKALELKPEDPDVLHNLGTLYAKTENLDEAKRVLKIAIRIDPSNADSHNHLGGVYMQEGNAEKAAKLCKKSATLNPNNPDSLNNLAVALQNLGKIEEALATYKESLEIDPNSSEVKWNYASCCFLRGDYKTGLKFIDERFANPRTQIHCKPQSEPWGKSSLQGCEELLLITEQGLGDCLQFIRFVPILKEMGIKVSLCAPEKLHSLIRASNIHQNPLKIDHASQVSDTPWLPIVSVIKLLDLNPKEANYGKAYLSTSPSLKSKWQEILKCEQKPIVGINWQGNKSQERGNLIGRSFPLESLRALSEIKSIKLLSLQKGSGSEQLDTCSFRPSFVSSQQQIETIWDFTETAAIIENCDLIITNDTSIAHLAGGLGKATWVLLKNVPDWRWGLEKRTFWYPSMRLFRQKENNNWNDIIEELVAEVSRTFPAK